MNIVKQKLARLIDEGADILWKLNNHEKRKQIQGKLIKQILNGRLYYAEHIFKLIVQLVNIQLK